MNLILSVLCAIYFIMVSSNFPNIVSGSSTAMHNNRTNHGASWESTRTKRSVFEKKPKVLMLDVQYITGEVVDLILYKRTQHLANEHLPVVTPLLYHNPNLMEDIGELISYQDASRCAALVYFVKTNSLYGVIGMNYHVRNLPFTFDEDGYYPEIVGEPYVVKSEYTLAHMYPIASRPILPGDTNVPEDQPGPSGYGQGGSLRQLSDSDAGPSNKRQRTKRSSNGKNAKLLKSEHDVGFVLKRNRRAPPRLQNFYYFEILIFVTRDVCDKFKELFGDEEYIKRMVEYYILYFNAVDTIFQKLYISHQKFHINFAKIEIEDELTPFEFITDGEVIFDEVGGKLSQYFHTYSSAYPPDSFDFVFISTSRPIFHQSVKVHGATKHGDDLHEARMRNEFYNAVPITILGFDEDYAVAVHEISQIFGIRIESSLEGLRNEGQCYSIMQEGSSKCDQCLRWSSDNEREFEAFFRENRNKCFLLNHPRSLSPPGISILLTPDRQCKCYGYDSFQLTPGNTIKRSVDSDGCSKNLHCQNGFGIKARPEYPARPFDGTPCTLTKVCWAGECVPIISNQCKTRL